MKKQSLSGEKRGSGKRKMRHPTLCSALDILAHIVAYECDILAKEKQLQSQTGSGLTNYSMQASSSVSFLGPNNYDSVSAAGSSRNNSIEGGSRSFRKILGPKKEVPESSKGVKKNLKRKKPKKEGRTNQSKKHKNVKVLDQQPELPVAYKDKIQELEGCEVKLVIQKELFKSDLDPNLGRFSIPIKQIREEAKNLLTQSEELSLDEREGDKRQRLRGLEVLVMDPCLKHCNMCLKKWTMKRTQVYNITSGWNDVVRNNDLKVKDMVQLWSFRSNNQLCFAIVKLEEASM